MAVEVKKVMAISLMPIIVTSDDDDMAVEVAMDIPLIVVVGDIDIVIPDDIAMPDIDMLLMLQCSE